MKENFNKRMLKNLRKNKTSLLFLFFSFSRSRFYLYIILIYYVHLVGGKAYIWFGYRDDPATIYTCRPFVPLNICQYAYTHSSLCARCFFCFILSFCLEIRSDETAQAHATFILYILYFVFSLSLSFFRCSSLLKKRRIKKNKYIYVYYLNNNPLAFLSI